MLFPPFLIEASISLLLSQISANRENFAAYSLTADSVVLLGHARAQTYDQPLVLPALQNKAVIAVAVGDFHHVALTAAGKVFTWGTYMKGCLGLGDPDKLKPGEPGAFAAETGARRADVRWSTRGRIRHRWGGRVPAVNVPSEVHFDWDARRAERMGEGRFCISITAAGWHSGALVADLNVSKVSFFLRCYLCWTYLTVG